MTQSKAMQTVMDPVIDFHRDHQVPMRATPGIPADERVRLRARLLIEELGETLAAMFDENHRAGEEDFSIAYAIDRLQMLVDDAPIRVDLVGLADGLADIQYVTIGAALEFGIPHDRTWAEVCASNATKKGATKRADGKIEKPPTYRAPDIRAVLFPDSETFPTTTNTGANVIPATERINGWTYPGGRARHKQDPALSVSSELHDNNDPGGFGAGGR